MSKTIDARGLACPEPVVLTKKSLDAGENELVILVDNLTASENVSKLAAKSGCRIAVVGEEPSISITLVREAPTGEPAAQASIESAAQKQAATKSVLVVNSDELGVGEGDLGKLLRKSFLGALVESPAKPSTLIVLNTGVKLVVEGSPALEPLQQLLASGTEILACGTCLDFFGLKEKVAVGEISNMYNFIDLLMTADKVVTF